MWWVSVNDKLKNEVDHMISFKKELMWLYTPKYCTSSNKPVLDDIANRREMEVPHYISKGI